EHGVVHRDLKPANVLLTSDGTPKITDFGLAKHLGGSAGSPDHAPTLAGDILGTPEYMAPEQAAGRTDLGPAVDVYALGVILYQMLTGRCPFQAPSALETMKLVATQDPVSPSRCQRKVPRDRETVCLKCLEKEPAKRYGSARDLADDLRRFRDGEPIRARPVGAAEKAWRWARRRPAVAALGLTAVLTLLAGAGVSLFFAVVAGQNEHEARVAQGHAEAEWTRAENARVVADRLRAESDVQAAELYLQRGLDWCEGGEPAKGVHWMLAALRKAPADAADLQRVIRTNLSAWSDRIHALRHHLDAGREIVLSPDGQSFFALNKDQLQRYDVATGQKVGDAITTPRLEDRPERRHMPGLQ